MINMTQKEREDNQPVGLDVIHDRGRQTKTAKTINRFILVAMLVAAIGLGVIIKWAIADTKVIEIYNAPVPTHTLPDPSGKTGGIISLDIDYCKYVSVTGELRISYVSKSREVFLPLEAETLRKGCASRELPVIIPLNLVPDEYRIKLHSTYNINPLKRNIIAVVESQPFTVGVEND